CFHPSQLTRPEAQGFFGFVIVQEHLDAIECGSIAIDLEWRGERLEPLILRVSAVASHLAARYPLDLEEYEVAPSRTEGLAPTPPHRLVFPGLGGVGGASLNQLFRRKLVRDGGGVTAYFEADQTSLWSRVLAAGVPDYRWIDGHDCYAAAK